ncbi:hypothetical protein [Methylogaea oryzae]
MTWRIGLSIALFLGLVVASQLAISSPTASGADLPLPPRQRTDLT